MKAIHQLLSLILIILFQVISAEAQPKIILKLDDLRATNGSSKFIPVMDYLKEKKLKAGLGAIGNGFDNSSLGLLSPYINATNDDSEKLYEIWNHGWDHIEPEFKGTIYAYQKAHFEQTHSAILNYLGIQMQTFGPPFNQSDEITYKVVSENPNYKVFLFTSAVIPEVVSLQNRVDMENGVGNPEYTFFVDQYNSNSSLPFMILQGHPAMWDSAKLNQFKQIIEFLISKGCEFVNAYEMAEKTFNQLIIPSSI
jgi:peptidoglycan/xylan/chitin deacetylase (PgdA/CDA1 family)